MCVDQHVALDLSVVSCILIDTVNLGHEPVQGVSVQEVSVQGKVTGGMCPWDKCPGGTCPGGGGFCPVTTMVHNT